MREIALDTETTGLDPKSGHRIVEIGCVEMIGHVSTGNSFQVYIDPEREMPEEAFRVHGLSNDFLRGKPKFASVADDFLDFIGDSNLIIHNAAFDMGFLNAELERCGRETVHLSRAIDTVDIARQKFPGSPVNLDALCKRFQIDLSGRERHGALKDAELLARVYLELVGGREPGLVLSDEEVKTNRRATKKTPSDRAHREPRPHGATQGELAAHAVFLEKVTDPLWSS